MEQSSNHTTPPLLAAREARAEIARRGLTFEALATATGLTLNSLERVLYGGDQSRRAQRMIEAHLRQAFWTPPAVFAQRLSEIEFFGADIETLTATELQAEWRKRTCKRQVRRNKPLPLALLREDFTAATAAQTATATPENQ
jgi:transcriptional regulator with XRE-family HTH domain